MTLSLKEQKEIDELAQSLPSWQKHLAEFREKHPEMSPQEVMKKAGFTFRMKKGKLIQNWWKPKMQKIFDEVEKESLHSKRMEPKK